MMNSQMQGHGGAHPISSSMPPWNPMWGPQPGPPMHVPPPPGQPPPPPQTGAPIPTMPNGIIPTGYPQAWNSSQQTGAYAAGNGWTQPPNYQNYQQWSGYGYPPQGWAQGYSYGPYNTTYPTYGQTTGQTAVNAGQTQVAQTPMTGNVGANAGAAVGAYMSGAGVAANLTAGAQPVIPTVGSSVPQAVATIGSYPQEASSYGPARVGSYTSAPNYANYALQGQGDASSVAASAYAGANPSNPGSAPYTRASSQAQGYHPYRRV